MSCGTWRRHGPSPVSFPKAHPCERMPMSQAITPELRDWIVEQARRGCRPEDVLSAMQASGWQEEVAIAAMEEALSSVLRAQTVTQAPMATVALPEPSLRDEPAVLSAGDRDVRVLMSMASPRVVLFADLLSAQECADLIELARPRLRRSETVQTNTGASEVNASRTSEGMFFNRGENELCALIEARIAHLLNWPVENGEGLQILRYEPGAQYEPHYDYFDPDQPGTPAILRRGGQRVGTLIIYLNAVLQGGGTRFPDVGLEVAPAPGHGVFFSYDRPQPATRSLHAGAPVISGEKWIATKWLRAGRFD